MASVRGGSRLPAIRATPMPSVPGPRLIRTGRRPCVSVALRGAMLNPYGVAGVAPLDKILAKKGCGLVSFE